MSLLKSLKNNIAGKSLTINPGEYRGGDLFFWDDRGHEHLFRYSGHHSSLKAYTKCPPLQAIINRKAQAYINGNTFIMNTAGKEATSMEAKKLRKLLAKPNPIQSWKQFEAQQQIYIQLFGFCLLFPIIPVGYEKYGPIEATSIWNIPPNLLTIEETNKLFYQTDQSGIISSIKLSYRNTDTMLPVNSVYIFKDITPSFNTLLFPESRVCALEMPINNIIGALESRNVLINYRGALGAFTHEPGGGQYGSLPMTPQQKEELQKDFLRYGLKNKQWKFIISTAAVKWQQIGIPTKDLLLMEEVQEATKHICDGYNYPPHLLGLIDPTFNNQQAAEKGLYQNTIIPEANSNYEQWNNLFRTVDYNITIQKDYSHLPILQDDEKSKAAARLTRNQALQIEFYNNMITLNRWLELNGEDTLPGTEGKQYYYQLVASGWKFGQTGAIPGQNNTNNGSDPTESGAAQS